MDKRDIYDSKNKWRSYLEDHSNNKIEGLSDYNSKLILDFLRDMELGKNTSKHSPKGERSYLRLLSLKSRLIFISKQFNKKKLTALSKDDVHKLFSDMKNGVLKKADGKSYKSTGDYVKDFKCFWNWLLKLNLVKENIHEDLARNRDEKPSWVYLNEEQFKTLINHSNPEYKPLIVFFYDTGCRVSEGFSIKVSDFTDDYKQVTIRSETSKNKYGRTIHLKLCSQLIKDYVEFNKLKKDDFLILKKQPAFNKYLKSISNKLFGDGVSSPVCKGKYSEFSIYDIRHCSSAYWLARYSNHSNLMYRMGWSSEKFVRYYSEFLGQSDKITDEDMILGADKNKVVLQEQEINKLKEEISELRTIKEELPVLKQQIPQLLKEMQLLQKLKIEDLLKHDLGKLKDLNIKESIEVLEQQN